MLKLQKCKDKRSDDPSYILNHKSLKRNSSEMCCLASVVICFAPSPVICCSAKAKIKDDSWRAKVTRKRNTSCATWSRVQNGFVQSAGKALKNTGSWLGWVAVGTKCWMGCNTLRWVWVGLVLDALLSKLGVGCCLVWPEMHWALQHWAPCAAWSWPCRRIPHLLTQRQSLTLNSQSIKLADHHRDGDGKENHFADDH